MDKVFTTLSLAKVDRKDDKSNWLLWQTKQEKKCGKVPRVLLLLTSTKKSPVVGLLCLRFITELGHGMKSWVDMKACLTLWIGLPSYSTKNL